MLFRSLVRKSRSESPLGGDELYIISETHEESCAIKSRRWDAAALFLLIYDSPRPFPPISKTPAKQVLIPL